MANHESPRVVITGYGCVSSLGDDARSTFEAMMAGQRAIRNEREWLESQIPSAYLPEGKPKLRSHLAARVGEVALLSDPAFQANFDQRYIDRYLSRSAELAFKASAEALRHAGVVTHMLELDAVEPERFAFVIGTGIGGGIEIGNLRSQMARGEGIAATAMNRAQPDNATVMSSLFYKARGPSATLTAACASGNFAIGDAVRRLERGEVDIIAAGGVEALDATVVATFERTGAASTDDNPELASRPFNAEPGKAILSEGAGFLILEREEHAVARNADIYGVVAGFGETNDAHDPTLLSGEGIIKAMRIALAQGRVGKDERIFLSAHATATPKGDEAERDAIDEVFSGQDYEREQIKGRVTSTKGFTGHPVGSANAIEAVVAVMALNEGRIPEASWIGEGEALQGMEDLIPDGQEGQIDTVLSNGMGFGGQNSSIVIKKPTA
ncbi:beta-ketoacyl-[acyl-carrier-protein] synthase family protein [Candidatus Saccharibacteria bacterium]|nr:beta-ketoacyl-[acyl-carrier-protein] synthase family protein [Candidatus Saccharibacteria bacterium]